MIKFNLKKHAILQGNLVVSFRAKTETEFFSRMYVLWFLNLLWRIKCSRKNKLKTRNYSNEFI